MLADIVSKNGNLMLSVPLQRDGTPDADEIKIVSDIGAWLKVNGDAIYATRPWKIYGEGPSTVSGRKGTLRSARATCRKNRSRRRTSGSRSPRTAKHFTPSSSHSRRTAKSPSNRSPASSPHWPGTIGSVRMLGASRETEIHPRRKRLARHASGKATLQNRFRAQNSVLRNVCAITGRGQWRVRRHPVRATCAFSRKLRSLAN